MATLVQNAVRIKQTFDDIYDAIVEKGVTPSGGVDTYPDAIDAIKLGIPPELATFTSGAIGELRSGGTSTNLLYIGSGSSTSTYFIGPSSNKWTCQKSGYYVICAGYGIHTNTTSGSAMTMRIYRNNSVVYTFEFNGAKGSHINSTIIPFQAGQTLQCSYQAQKKVSSCYISIRFMAYYIGRSVV